MPELPDESDGPDESDEPDDHIGRIGQNRPTNLTLFLNRVKKLQIFLLYYIILYYIILMATLTPQGYLGVYISKMRNIFLTSSIAFVMFSFGNNLDKEYKITLRIVSILMFIYSISYAIKSIIDCDKVIDVFRKNNVLDEHYKFYLNQIEIWIIYTYVYIGILITIIIILLIIKFSQLYNNNNIVN